MIEPLIWAVATSPATGAMKSPPAAWAVGYAIQSTGCDSTIVASGTRELPSVILPADALAGTAAVARIRAAAIRRRTSTPSVGAARFRSRSSDDGRFQFAPGATIRTSRLLDAPPALATT